jgi:hypothetical protein
MLTELTGTPVARGVHGRGQVGASCGVFAAHQGVHTVAGSCSGVQVTHGSGSTSSGVQVSECHVVSGPTLNATPLRAVPIRSAGSELFDRVSSQLGKAPAVYGGPSPMGGMFLYR